MSLLIFILILVALIWVHELGHFSVAKFFGIKVEEFAIGFPPRLFVVQWGETKYTFNLLLLGGFVRIHGENDQSDGAADPRSFASRSRPVQAAVLVAGVTFNILFAWLAFSVGYMAGMPTSAQHDGFGTVVGAQPVVLMVMPESPAAAAGLMGGDVITRMETATEQLPLGANAEAIREFIATHEEQSLVVSVLRNGEEQIVVARAEEGFVEGRRALGIQLDDVGVLRLPPHLALLQGALATKNLTVATAVGLGTFFSSIVTGTADFSGVAGPIGIATIGSQAVNAGFAEAVFITALISINLAIINLLPIPGLDGGRLVIVGVESVLRRPISQKVTTGLMFAGFAFIIILMILVSAQDIARLIG